MSNIGNPYEVQGLDFSEANELQEYSSYLPTGKYLVMVEDYEIKTTKTDKTYYQLKLTVLLGKKYEGSIFFESVFIPEKNFNKDTLEEIEKAKDQYKKNINKLFTLFLACGIDLKKESFDIRKLKNKAMIIIIKQVKKEVERVDGTKKTVVDTRTHHPFYLNQSEWKDAFENYPELIEIEQDTEKTKEGGLM